MSAVYSRGFTSNYIDPRIDQPNSRVEFRFDKDKLYSSNLRLVNVGANVETGGKYNFIAGCYGVIKHIRLMDGNQELSSLREANRYLSFLNVNNSNADNVNVVMPLNKSSNGYELNDEAFVDTCATELVDNDIEPNINTMAVNEKRLGTLDLRHALPLLSSMSMLNTGVFENLRLVVELESDNKKVSQRDDRATKTQRPLLIADSLDEDMVSEKILKASMADVNWFEVEHDLMTVPDNDAAVAGEADGFSVEQKTSNTINGFNNKFLNRMLICTDYSVGTAHFAANTVQGPGHFGSLHQFRRRLNARINGSNLFSGDGLTSRSQIGMLLSRTYGDVNIPLYGDMGCIGDELLANDANNNTSVPVTVLKKQSPLVGHFQWIGFSVGDRINNFVLEHSRTNVKDILIPKQNNAALDLHLFGEVRKTIQFMSNGSNMVYNVSYA